MKRNELYDVIAGLDEELQERAYELDQLPKKPFMPKKVLMAIISSVTFVAVAAVAVTLFAAARKKENGDNKLYPAVTATVPVRMLSYDGLNDRLISFNINNFGVNLISTSVRGEHEDCEGVFYDQETGEIICLKHRFLDSSGIAVCEGNFFDFTVDPLNKNLVVVEIKEPTEERLADLWAFEIDSGKASRIPLCPQCSDYSVIGISRRGLRNGLICLCTNTQENHTVHIYNIKTGVYMQLPYSGTSYVSGEFLSDCVLALNIDGVYYFSNVETGAFVKVVGEYNYSFGDKVFSVKNWGWANHNDVAVAAYDANTGESLDNENVIVQTVSDEGVKIYILKNTGTGEERVILNNYTENCSGWSNDYSCFYAYSEKNGKMLAFRTDTQTWYTTDVEGVPRDPEFVSGRLYAVFADYSLAIGDDNRSVIVYYTRSIEEIRIAPDYENERVESQYWDEYRNIKYLNFHNETCFEYSRENDIGDGFVYGREITDMELLRDIILECLEARGAKVKETFRADDAVKIETLLSCGTFRLYFLDYGSSMCICMPRNVPQPIGYEQCVYEIPKAVYESIRSRLDGYFE